LQARAEAVVVVVIEELMVMVVRTVVMAMMEIPTILHAAAVEAGEISYADVKYLCLVLWHFSNTS